MTTMKKKFTMAAATVAFAVCAFPMVSMADRFHPPLTFFTSATYAGCFSSNQGQVQANNPTGSTCGSAPGINFPLVTDGDGFDIQPTIIGFQSGMSGTVCCKTLVVDSAGGNAYQTSQVCTSAPNTTSYLTPSSAHVGADDSAIVYCNVSTNARVTSIRYNES